MLNQLIERLVEEGYLSLRKSRPGQPRDRAARGGTPEVQNRCRATSN